MAEKTQARETDAWMPTKKGESISGTVEEISMANGSFGPYPMLSIVDDAQVPWKIHGFRTVLTNLILEKQPMVGERITVTYDGPRAKLPKDGDNNPPTIYRLVVHGRDNVAEAHRVYAQLAGKKPSEGDSLEAQHADTAPF